MLVSEELTSGDLVLEQSAEVVLPTIKRPDPAPVPPSPLPARAGRNAGASPVMEPPSKRPLPDGLAPRGPGGAPQKSETPGRAKPSGAANARPPPRQLDPTYIPPRRTRLPIAVVIVGALLAIGLGVGASLGLRAMKHREALEAAMAAVVRADQEGTRDSIRAARDKLVGLSDEPARAALARLLAVLALEHAEHGAAEEAHRAWNELEPEARRSDDAALAQAALALVRANPQQATDLISGIRDTSPRWAEAARLSALVDLLAGDLNGARRGAEIAAAVYPQSPRHVALAAIVQAFGGETERALARLDTVPDHRRYPAIRIARARINLFSGRSPSDAAAEALAVLEEPLGQVASPPERAWARLVRAWYATSTSDATRAELEGDVQQNGEALGLVRQARGERPLVDEHFRLVAAEVLLRLGQAREAQSELNARPDRTDITAGFQGQRRATLLVLAALAEGDLSVAEAALTRLPANDGTTSFLRGRLEETRLSPAEARRHYAEAAQRDPRLREAATLRVAAIDLANGAIDQAHVALRSLVVRAAGTRELAVRPSVQLASMLVRTHVARGELDAAVEVLESARQAAPGDPRLAVAEAEILYARGHEQWERATQSLDAALRERPDELALALARAELARRTGDAARARRIFDEVLRASPQNPDALLGLAALESAATRLEQAADALARAERARAAPARLELERARYQVAQGLGGEALEALGRVAARSQRDPDVLALYGRAFLQAEKRDEARARFTAALRLDPDSPEALLGLVYLSPTSSEAPRRLTRAEQSGIARELGGFFACRLFAARARYAFEMASTERPMFDALATAERQDAHCGEAFVVRALRAEYLNADSAEHWVAATQSPAPVARALSHAARSLSSSDLPRACGLAARYLRTAPEGEDARDMRELRQRCPAGQ